MTRKPKPTKHPKALVYRPITTLLELEAVCDEPVIVECVINEKPIRFQGKRLTPDQGRRVKLLLELAMPRELPPVAEGGEPRYDFRDPEYMSVKEANQRKARALALYWAFPLFREGLVSSLAPPGESGGGASVPASLPTEAQIMEFVESRPVDNGVLDLAFTLLTREIVKVDPRRVGFTSGSNSPAS